MRAKLEVKCGIYSITSPSGKVYIGSSKHILKRWWYYRKVKCVKQIKLFNSLKKYGTENHVFKIEKECDFIDLFKYEREIGLTLDCVNNGLNLKLPNYGDLPSIVSEETRKKMSISTMGNKHTLGYIPTAETRALISKNNKGKILSKETKEKMSKSAKGRKWSDDMKKKFSNIKKGSMGKNPNAKIVLDLYNGIYYECGKEAAICNNIDYNSFRNTIKKQNRFIYA
jgi:group I intron endonuclease